MTSCTVIYSSFLNMQILRFDGCFSATAGESRWLSAQIASYRGEAVSDAIRCFRQSTPSISLNSMVTASSERNRQRVAHLPSGLRRRLNKFKLLFHRAQ